ncbi:MAG: AAA family ATPase [Alphaproteobacteria bacterium]|nr:AAA family ATPase [Alphaproteobacteria bacterium]
MSTINRKIFDYIYFAVKSKAVTHKQLLTIMERYQDEFNFDYETIERKLSYQEDLSRKERNKELFVHIQSFIDNQYRRNQAQSASYIEKNIDILAKCFQLNQCEKEIFTLMFYYEKVDSFENIIVMLFDIRHLNRANFIGICRQLLGFSTQQIMKACDDKSNLFTKSLIKQSHYYNQDMETNERFIFILDKRLKNIADIPKYLLNQKPLKANLTISDFDYMADKMAVILDILDYQKSSANILLYGAPGTGKTELAKTLAHASGRVNYRVGNSSVEGDEPSRTERIADLNFHQTILHIESKNNKQQKYCLLFDEAEDFFDRGHGFFMPKSGSKQYMNTMLEQNSIPVIWCTNDIEQIDSAFLRRFDYILEIKIPPLNAQINIWQKELKAQKIHLDAKEIKMLIKTYKPSIALMKQALTHSKKSKNKSSALFTYFDNFYKAVHGKAAQQNQQNQHGFNPKLVNTDIDISKLTKQLCLLQSKEFSLCLYGVSGSGKTAYGRYLAEQLGMEILYKRASDLLDCYVGESEKNIARTFEQAKDEDAVLIIDEADSFLRERNLAEKSWEVTAVNEMLVQMEYHPLPFICSTNLFDTIDKASLRRFTFKIKYDYLTMQQVQQAMKHFFDMEIAPQSIKNIDYLTPGDFANIYKKAKILDALDDAKMICSLFNQELMAKNISNPIGF